MTKLSGDDLKRLLRCVRKDPEIVVPPLPGFDSGVHKLGEKFIVVSTDPCVGVPDEWFGWLLIHYVASDVALFGAKPRFCTINLLGPPSTDPKSFHEIMKQASQAANELNIAIVAGHTGTYRGLRSLLGVCTAYGEVKREKLITPGDAQPGDDILCVKSIGLETAINYALTRRESAVKLFGADRVRRLIESVEMQSCVKEALLLAESEGVNAMHDATEGGVITALNEMAETSKVGFRVEAERIARTLPEEVLILGRSYRLSYTKLLSMSSTGTILAAVSHERTREIQTKLRECKVESNVIGVFTEEDERLILRRGKKEPFPEKSEDPYEMILSS
jgi:hydrogenase maturation factor